MILHYIKIAFRNLLKQKTQSLISIIGLAIGLSFFSFGLYWLNYETSYDNFFPDSERIYRIYSVGKQSGIKDSRVPGMVLKKALLNDFNEVENVAVAYRQDYSLYKSGDIDIWLFNARPVDTGYFKMFPRKVLWGKKDNPIQTEKDIVITEENARKYFKNPEEAIGKQVNDWGNRYNRLMTITAVIENPDKHSNFHEDAIYLIEPRNTWESSMPEDKQWLHGYEDLYVKLKKGTNVKAFKNKLRSYTTDKGYNAEITLETAKLSNMKHVLGSNSSFSFTYIRTFAAASLLLLLCVFFNFLNLLFNRSLQRVREIRLRKSLGADRQKLIRQLMAEVNMQLIIAFVLSALLLLLALPLFTRVFESAIDQEVLFSGFIIVILLTWLLLSVVCVIPIAHFIIKDSEPSNTSKNSKSAPRKRLLRQTGLIIQLSICTFFLLSTFILYRQLNQMNHHDYGFEKDGLIQMRMDGDERDLTMQEVAKLPMVTSYIPTSLFNISHNLGRNYDVNWENKPADFKPYVQIIEASPIFFEGFKIPLVAGEYVTDKDIYLKKTFFFMEDSPMEAWSDKAVVNEKFAKLLNTDNPIGKEIDMDAGIIGYDGSTQRNHFKIAGVVKNFQSLSLQHEIPPVVIVIKKTDNATSGYFNYVRVKPGTEQEAIKEITKIFKKHSKPSDDGESKAITVNDLLNELNKSENASLRLFAILTIVCILISIFGIYAISLSDIERRKREVAIRKVMGASEKQVIKLFFKEYIWIAILSGLIALPPAGYFMHQWISQYPYRITIAWWMYALVFAFTLFVIIITILYQVNKASRSNPAVVIKNE